MPQDPRPTLTRRTRRAGWAVFGLVTVGAVGFWTAHVLPSSVAGDPVQLPPVHTVPASPDASTSAAGNPARPGPGHHLRPQARPALQPTHFSASKRCRLQPPRLLTVLQFNIHGGISRYGGSGLSRIAEEIRSWKPDVVSLNEVDSGAARSGGVDEAAYLAKATGLRAVFGPNLVQADGRRFGNAVLTRFPVSDSHNVRLPGARGQEPRGLLGVRLEVDGRSVAFYSVHLTQGARAGLPVRIRQTEAIARVLRGSRLPTVLAGDLNSHPDTWPVRILRGYLLDAQQQGGSGRGATVPEGHPVNRIDYILYDNHFRPLPGSTQVLPSGASDHRAVFTELVLRPPSC